MNSINVEHFNLGTVNQNEVRISTDRGDVTLSFSYNTIVAINGTVSENNWSSTTGKLLNKLQPDKSLRVSHEKVLKEVKRLLKAIL